MVWKRNENEIDPLNYSTTVIFMVAWLYEGSFRNLFPLRWPTNRFRLFPRNVTSDLNIKQRRQKLWWPPVTPGITSFTFKCT